MYHATGGALAAKERNAQAMFYYKLQFVVPVVIFTSVAAFLTYVPTWRVWLGAYGWYRYNGWLSGVDAVIGILLGVSEWLWPFFCFVLAVMAIAYGHSTRDEPGKMLLNLGLLVILATGSAVFVGYVGYSWYMRLYDA